MIRSAISPKPKLSRCEACRCKFPKQRMGQVVCGPKCAADLAAKAREKKAKADYKARKEAIKTRSDWIKETQTAFNAVRREECRLAGYPCISCNRPLDWTGNKVDAGHYRSVGSAPHMRFTEMNVWAQCKQCNQFGSGRAVDYRIGLIKRIGLEAVEALEADQTPRKWTIEELKAIKATYKAKLKELLGKGEQ